MTLKFEWDKSKAKDNYAKHGVSFEVAKRAFKDPFALEFLDDREHYGEERFVIIGMIDGHIFYAVSTERKDTIRFISARRATTHAQEAYL